MRATLSDATPGRALVRIALVLVLLVAGAWAQITVIDTTADLIERVTEDGQLGEAVFILDNTAVTTAPFRGRGATWVLEFEDPEWNEVAELNPLDGGTELDPDDNQFGASVAYHGDISVVGSPEDNDYAEQGGAVYVFKRPRLTQDWFQFQKLSQGPDTRRSDQFGYQVALNENFLCVSAPQRDKGFGFETAGAVYTYRRDLQEDGIDRGEFFELVKVLFAQNAQLTDFLGWSISLEGTTLAAGIYGRDSTTDSDVGAAIVWEYRKTDTFLFDWFEDNELVRADALVNDRFGQSVSVHGDTMVVGSAGDNNVATNRPGAALVYRRNSATRFWSRSQTLSADTPVINDRYGFQVAVFDRWLTVAAPQHGDAQGLIYGYRQEVTDGPYELVIRLRSSDDRVGEEFGGAMTLSDAFILVGTPRRNDFLGALWTFNGYEYFPIKAPRFFIPEGGIPGRLMEELTNGDSFLINDTWPMHVTARFRKEVSIVTLDGTDPNFLIHSPTTTDGLVGSPVAEAGGYVNLPYLQSNYTVKAVAFNGDFNFSSTVNQVWVRLWIATPGFWWHRDRYLLECGHANVYCPGQFEDPYRYGVQLAYYSAPTTVNETIRSFEKPCEQDRYCEEGRRFFCFRDCNVGEIEPCRRSYCWPRPVSAVARQAHPGELDDNGTDYFSLRAFGVGVGDVIEVTFDELGTQPPMNTTEAVLALFGFNEDVAIGLKGVWQTPSLLYITITEGDWRNPALPDPALTRIGVLNFTINPDGNLRRQNITTLPAQFPFAFNVSGTWGAFPAPQILFAEAFGGPLAHNASGPAPGDYLDVTFEYPVQTRPVATEADLANLIIFSPAIVNVTYSGEWLSWNVLRVTFNELTETFYPNLQDLAQAVGNLEVAINPAANLLARDHSNTAPADTAFVVTTGTWGDIPQDLVLSLRTNTSINVHWIEPTTAAFSPLEYVCEATDHPNFDEALATRKFTLVRDAADTVTYDPAVVPFAYDEEYLWDLQGLPSNRTYWVRCAAQLQKTRGPWRASLPPSLFVAEPAVIEIDRFTTDINTRGGPVNVHLRNMGYGRHVVSLPVEMTYSNGINAYGTNGCQMWWNGSTVTCQASEGVGRGHRWQMQLFGFPGAVSPATAITNYKPPVVYDIISEFNNTITAPSAGNEPYLVIGNNFCCNDDDVFRVYYHPLDRPDVQFNATCTIFNQHDTLKCLTGEQAGADLRWTANIAGQESQPVFTTTQVPNITRVDVFHIGDGVRSNPDGSPRGFVPISQVVGSSPAANASLGLATSGGGIVVLTGQDFGPANRQDQIPLNVTFRPTRALPTGDEYWVDMDGGATGVYANQGPRTDFGAAAEFVCPVCVVTVAHVEVTCVVPEGFGGQLEWTMTVFGRTSQPFRSNISYGVPVLELLPHPHEEQNIFSNPAIYPLEPQNTLPKTRQHRDFSKLHWMAYLPDGLEDDQVVTDCDLDDPTLPALIETLAGIESGLAGPTPDLEHAVFADNLTALTWAGYPRGGGNYVDYKGGRIFFMRDRANNRFNPSGTCTAWIEPMIMVSSDDHWVTFTGYNFAAGFDGEGGAANAVVDLWLDGERQATVSAVSRDHELIEVLVPPFLGRRRLQVSVNGVRSNAFIIVNQKPAIHGFMEWRLGMEDTDRGESPPAEDAWPGDASVGDDGWGGFGAWDDTEKCMRISVTGFHFGSVEDMLAGRTRVTVNARDCELFEVPRHNRLTCCSRYAGGEVEVFVAGRKSDVVEFTTEGLIRKPIITTMTPETTSTAGEEDVHVEGLYFLHDGEVLYSTKNAEAIVPTGYETKVGGNYNDIPVFLSAPSPSPLPPESPTAAELEFSDGARGCTWLSFHPIVEDVPFFGTVINWAPTKVVAITPQNHADGHYLRIAVASGADRSLLYTWRRFLANYVPTITEIYPPNVPLSGGIINLIGFSFGNGGSVTVEQRLFYDSTSVPGDPAFAGKHTVAHESDHIGNRNTFLGRSGGSVGRFPRILQDADGTQEEIRIVSAECLPLAWNHSHIRCLAPPGTDNNSVVVINVGHSRGTKDGLVYQPAIPCLYNTTFSDAFEEVAVDTWMEQFQLGLWSGFLVGLALWVAFVLLFIKLAKRDPRDLFRPDVEVAKPAPQLADEDGDDGFLPSRRGGARLANIKANPALDFGDVVEGLDDWERPGDPGEMLEDGSFVASSYATGSHGGKRAPVEKEKGRSRGRRNTEEIVMAKQVKLIGSTDEDDELSRFLKSSGLATGEWKPKTPRDSMTSMRELIDKVQEENKEMEEVKKRERYEAMKRRKQKFTKDGRLIPPGKWWQCLCCRPKPPPLEEDPTPPPSDDDEIDLSEMTPRTRAAFEKQTQEYLSAMKAAEGKEDGEGGGGGGGDGDGDGDGDKKKGAGAGAGAGAGSGGGGGGDDSDGDIPVETGVAESKSNPTGRRRHSSDDDDDDEDGGGGRRKKDRRRRRRDDDDDDDDSLGSDGSDYRRTASSTRRRGGGGGGGGRSRKKKGGRSSDVSEETVIDVLPGGVVRGVKTKGVFGVSGAKPSAVPPGLRSFLDNASGDETSDSDADLSD